MVKEVLFFIFIRHFSQDSHDFSQRWEKMRDFLGKRGVIFYFLYFLTSFFFFFLLFPKKCPIFPKNKSFSGKLWEKDCFALFSAVLLQRRRNKTTPKWFGDLETTSDYFIIWILRLWEWWSRARLLPCRARRARTARWWSATSCCRRWAASTRTNMLRLCSAIWRSASLLREHW